MGNCEIYATQSQIQPHLTSSYSHHHKFLEMSLPFPYTYYACPCVNTSAPLPILRANQTRKTSREVPPIGVDATKVDSDEEDEEESFDPKSPRANFSLFPIDNLLWCTECHQMRCARCMFEEVVCWYCPSCLFEVPSSTVRSDGNRFVYPVVSKHTGELMI